MEELVKEHAIEHVKERLTERSLLDFHRLPNSHYTAQC